MSETARGLLLLLEQFRQARVHHRRIVQDTPDDRELDRVAGVHLSAWRALEQACKHAGMSEKQLDSLITENMNLSDREPQRCERR